MRLEQSYPSNTSKVFYHIDWQDIKLDKSFQPHEHDWEEHPQGLGILLQRRIQTNKVIGQQDLWISEPDFASWIPPISFVNSIVDDTAELIIQSSMNNPEKPGFKLSSRQLAENPDKHFNLTDTNFEWLVYDDDMYNERTLAIPGPQNIYIDGWIAYPEYESNLLHEIESGTGVYGLATGIDSASLNSIRYCLNKFIGQLAQTRTGTKNARQQFNVTSLHSQLTNEINQAIDRFKSKDSSSSQETSVDLESSLYNLR